MDKKHVILGVLFLAASIVAFIWTSQQEAERRQEEAARRAADRAEQIARGENPDEIVERQVAPSPLVRTPELVAAEDAGIDPLVRGVRERLSPEVEEETAALENGFYRAVFTSRGAALKTVALTKQSGDQLAYPAELSTPDRPVVLHALAKTPPLSLAQRSGERFFTFDLDFALVSQSPSRLVFEATHASGLVFRRSFETVEGSDPSPENFTIRQELTLHNPTPETVQVDRLYLNIGTAAPTNADPYGMDLNASYFRDGDFKNIRGSSFKDGWFSSAKTIVEREGLIQWGAVKNQFFTSIVTPEQSATQFTAVPVAYPSPSGARNPSIGISAYLRFELPPLEPGSSETLRFDYYSGPKDFNRLKQMKLKQEDVMQFGWFLGMFLGFIGFVGKSLFWLLSNLHGIFGNWGFAIIGMTLIVRLALWPLTAKAARSSKRMQELQKPMQELKEKYKDNPQKQQQATLELFRKHKINPLSSCWPVLLQFPIFIAMFNLLRNTADLRFAPFLWIDDLSMPDATIPLGTDVIFLGSALNVLPFVWLVSMWFQMKMMPQPSVDNAQTKIIKYMPFIFFPFTYLFSSGLVLYWTTTNCFSIFQGWITRRTKDAEDIAIEQEIAESEKKKSTIKSTPLAGRKRKKKDDPRR
jgi:YidC/Oxa1 family membrane protein insertase